MTKNKLYLVSLSLLLFCFFVFFSFLTHKDLFTSLDFNTTVGIQDHFSRRFDTLFSLFSLLGSVEIVSIILLLILALTRKLKSIIVLFSYGAIHVIELFGKVFVTHPGPSYLFFRYDISFFFPSSYVQPGSSYPSGHGARTAFLSVLLLFLILRNPKINKKLKIIFVFCILIFCLVMFVSRIYLGEHWLSDVIGGSLLGAAMGIISLVIL